MSWYTDDRGADLLAELGEELRGMAIEFGAIWFAAIIMPWRVYREFIRPRDQSRAVRFAVGVVLLWVGVGVLAGTFRFPVLGGIPWLSAILWVGVLLLVVPVGIHLVTAVATLILIVLAPDRGTISETVQVISFSMAPMVFLAIPITEVQALMTVYAGLSMVYGVRLVHGISFERSVLVAAVPAYLLFGMGFGGEGVILELLRAWYII